MSGRRWVSTLVATLLLCTCKSAPPSLEGDDAGECSDRADNDVDGLFDCDDPDCLGAPDCASDVYPTEDNLFDDMLQGEAQLVSLCAQLADRGVQSVVRDAFCIEPRPQVTSSTELLAALGLPFEGPGGKDAQMLLDNGNPAWSVIGHTASLSRRTVSPVNPRVIVHTPTTTHLEPVPGFVATAFVRGEGFAEIITHDPVRDDLDFFLFKLNYRCADPPHCTDEERFSEQYESGWLDYTIYGEQDIENTPLDCLQCHQHGLLTSPTSRKSLLMFQLNSMWIHWMYDNRHFRNWTDNPTALGPFHDGMEQYVAAHGTEKEPLGETFAGVPNGAIYASRPKSLEDLLEVSGFGNGFDNTAYAANGSEIGLLQDDRGRGMFFHYVWEELYELGLHGLLITPPARGYEPFDRDKLVGLIDRYSAYRNGESSEFPDVTDLYEDANLAAVGLGVHPGLSPPEVLVHACSQCHHDALNPEISRAQFKLGPIARGRSGSSMGDHFADLGVGHLRLVQERINLPEDHLRVMPPTRFRTLTSDERAGVTEWLETLIDGLALADDGQPPTPSVAQFDMLPTEVTVPGPVHLNQHMLDSEMKKVQTSMAIMRATPGSDPTGYVEYYFEETSGSPGGTTSGWQLSPRYLDMDLVLEETYSYRVKMRDRSGNESGFSEIAPFELVRINPGCDHPGHDHEPIEGKDSDCDTVPDSEEVDGDTDGDGIPDYLDPDDDGDGFATLTEIGDGDIWGQDIDGDGLPTWLDLDSDGDSYSDELEGGGDNNDNLIPGYLDPDEPCGDGWCNSTEVDFHEDCQICPVDCGCEAGMVCVEAQCINE